MKEKLDVKIGTKEEALWTRVKTARVETIKDLEDSLIVEKEILKVAEKKIQEEQLK